MIINGKWLIFRCNTRLKSNSDLSRFFCFIESVSAGIMLQLYLNFILNWQDVSCLYIFKGDKTKRIKVEWEKSRGKRWFTKGLRMMNEMRGKNETLHSLYICFTFGFDLNGVWMVLLYIGAENVMFWAVLTAVWGISWASGRVWLLMWVLYRLDMEMDVGGA